MAMDPSGVHPANVDSHPPTDRVSDDVFAAAVTATRMAMVVSDPNRANCPVVYCNQAFLDLTGYTENEVLGRNCRFLQGRDTDPETVKRIGHALSLREDVHEEILNYRKDGSYFWNALQINALADADDRLRYFFASQKDITRQREAVFRQSQRMESLGALASGIAHQVSNLTTVVVGSVEGAVKRAVDQRQAEQLKRAAWGARRTGELSSALLAMARRQAVDESPIDLNEALHELQGTFTHVATEGITIELERATSPVVARVDPVQFDVVVLNLLRNACAALPLGGHVTVRTRNLPAAEAVEMLGVPEAVEFSVIDNGEGMSPEIERRATEVFFTTRDPGKVSGLGLFVALSFAEQSGGRLLLDTEQGRGTTVRVLIPREDSS